MFLLQHIYYHKKEELSMLNRKIVSLILSLVLINIPLSTIKAVEIPSNEYVQTSNEDTGLSTVF